MKVKFKNKDTSRVEILNDDGSKFDHAVTKMDIRIRPREIPVANCLIEINELELIVVCNKIYADRKGNKYKRVEE